MEIEGKEEGKKEKPVKLLPKGILFNYITTCFRSPALSLLFREEVSVCRLPVPTMSCSLLSSMSNREEAYAMVLMWNRWNDHTQRGPASYPCLPKLFLRPDNCFTQELLFSRDSKLRHIVCLSLSSGGPTPALPIKTIRHP